MSDIQILPLSCRYYKSKEKYNDIENPFSSKVKPIYRYIKLGFLVTYWSIFTLLLITKSEKPGLMNHLLVPSDGVANIDIAVEPISNKVKLNLEGPLVPVLQTNDANPSSFHLVVWLELITDYNNTDNYSQALTERWVIPILPLDLLKVFPKQETEQTLNVSKFDRTRGLVRLNFKTNSSKSLNIWYAIDLSPAGDDQGLLYGTVILIGLYIFIIFDVINRALAAMLASTMALAVLAFLNQRPTTAEIISWIDIDTLLLLFSMMILVAILGETGLFDYLAVFAYKITNGKVWPLIYTLCISTAILSSFLDNTTMVLLMTPVTIRLCEVMELNPVPILTAMVIYSNIGGTLTPVGDPPNVIITTNQKVVKAGVDFNNFVLHMSIGVIMAVIVASVQLKYIFHDTKLLKFGEPQEIQEMRHEIAIWQRAAASLSSYSREEKLVRDVLLQKVKSLKTALDNKLTSGRISTLKYRSTLEELQEKYQIRDKWMLLKTSITLIFVIVLFFLHNLPNVNLSLGWTTLLGVFLILILADTKDLDGILARVEWSTLIFFAALFILMEVVENDSCKIYWNIPFATTRRIDHNKPDIVLFDKTTRDIYVIEFSAPAEYNISAKEEHKLQIYQDLLFEIGKLHPGYRVKLVVLIVGVLGGMKQSFVSSLGKIPALSCMGLIAWIGKQTEWIILSVNEEFRLAVAIILILWVSGIASAFVDNVPLTTMMIRIITNLSQNAELGLPLQPLVWALAYGACMGGNATLIGATANVVCAGVAEQHGYPFTFMQFFKVGYPITIGSLLTATIYLLVAHIIFQWH